METFLKNLTSPYWWVSVVIVGITINLTSIYLQKKLDSQLSNASSWWRKRSEKETRKQLQEVERLKNNQQAQILMAFTEVRHHLKSIGALVATIFCLGFVGATFIRPEIFIRDMQYNPTILQYLRILGMAGASFNMIFSYQEMINAAKAKGLLIIASRITDNN